MSQETPTPDELSLLEEFDQDYSELLELAGHVAFVPRIEPRLLRSIRLEFLPWLDTVHEHQLWFSDLVFSRATGHLTFSPGVTNWLTQRIRPKLNAVDLQALWELCRQMTRHWVPLDRLERDLYFYSLTDNQDKLHQVFRDLLRLITLYAKKPIENRSRLIELSRRIKYGSAYSSSGDMEQGPGRLLAGFALNCLHDSGNWSTSQQPVALPDWLVSALPKVEGAHLSVELRSENGQYILHFKEPDESHNVIEFHGPLPTQLYIQSQGIESGFWAEVYKGSLVALDTPTSAVELTTRRGKHYRLQLNQTREPSPPNEQSETKLYLAFSKADENRAIQIQQWLKSQEIDVELIEERPTAPITAVTDPAIRVMRLWTEGMQSLWREWSGEQQNDSLGSLLLQIDDIQAPSGFSLPGHVIDIRNWQQDSSHELARELATQIGSWVEGAGHATRQDFFITYSERGKEWAYSIQSHLASHGFTIRLVDDVITPGDSWSDAIGQPLEQSACLIAVVTEDLVKSRSSELEFASSLGKTIIPVRVEEAEIPRYQSMVQAIEFVQEPIPWDELIGSCEQALGRSQSPDNDLFNELLKKIEDPQTMPEERLKIGDQLAEMGDPRPGVGVREFEIIEYPPEIEALLDEIDNSETKPERRLVIGDELEKLDDPRPGVGLDEQGLPDIDWVEIPGGEFIFGDEIQQRLTLDRFHIARYPITNVQYQAFIDDEGYEGERWWHGLEKQSLAKSNWNQANRPKERVSWYEAVAFCRWLSQQLGYEIRLPTKQEWEKAARGKDGREYPWGEGYRAGFANVNEKVSDAELSYLEQTTGVGLYPQGASSYGVMDMAGNVWEWCLNKYDKPEATAIDRSRDNRVLRGGSWVGFPELARAAFRYGVSPVGRDFDRGFRVVCVSPINR